MIRAVFVRTIMNKTNTRIIGYILKDEFGNQKTFTSSQIKAMLNNGTKIVGLKLGKDGRLLKDKKYNQKSININNKLAIYSGNKLLERCIAQSGDFKSRNFVSQIVKFCVDSKITNRIMLLHGLRRTGKTTGIHHSILELGKKGVSNICLIEVTDDSTSFNELYDILLKISKTLTTGTFGIVFIDEITNVNDIVKNFSKLSDQLYNLKIVVSGTDSYVFPIACKTTLFGRHISIHTTMLSYSEYRSLVEYSTFNTYVTDGSLSGQEFVGNAKAIDSVNSAVIGNINSTILRNYQFLLSDKHYDYSWLTKLSQQELSVIVYSILSSATEHKTDNSLSSIIKTIGRKRAEFIGNAVGLNSDTLPKRLEKVNNFAINNLIKVMSELDIIRQLNNLATMLCSDEQLNKGYKAVTDKAICILSPGLLNTMLVNLNTEPMISTGKKLENLVETALFFAERNNEYVIDTIGYLKYSVNEIQHEIDVVVKIVDREYNEKYALIEVKSNSKTSSSFAKHLVTTELPDGLRNKSVVKLIVYTGKTQEFRNIKYVNIEEFILNPWNFIV